ncbi:MAG TPA: 3-isopropylmalate dehydratase small subunit [Candidatus Obscuribacterales bacterium]
MKTFSTVTSKVIPLPMKDVDTDLIIPAQFLTSISRDGYGQNLFRRLRDNDPNFPLNQPRFQGASILVADSNFGCGSSREHAVWALIDAGIKVVMAKSFADIFYNNSAKNGLLLVPLAAEAVDQVLAEATRDDYVVTVDLEKQQVLLPNGSKCPFSYDPFRKHCMLNGLDDIDYIRSFAAQIADFRERQRACSFMSTFCA